MYDTVQDRGTRLSTTALTAKCPRSEFLKRTEPYVEKPGNLWAAFRGTMFHGQLERVAHQNAVPEVRYFMQLEGLGELSCSPDLVDIEQGMMYDYKFVKEVPAYEYPWPNHKEQLWFNRWIVDNATHAQVSGGERFLLTDRLRRAFVPDVWNDLIVVYMDDKRVKQIGVTKSVEIEGKNGNPRKVRVPDLGDDAWIESQIRFRYELLNTAFDSGAVPEIPYEFQDWEHPLCNYCPVKKECLKLWGKETNVEEV